MEKEVGEEGIVQFVNSDSNQNEQKESSSSVVLEEPPVADAYSAFVAKNPWRAWVCGLFVMLILIMLGMAVTFGVKGNFGLAGADVGFESRGSTLAGKIIAFNHIRKGECTKETSNALTLAMDGQRSRVYRYDVEEESENPAVLTADQCYSGYKSGNNRRHRRRRLQNIPPAFRQTYYEEVSRDNQNAILENAKWGISMLFKGADLLTAESLKGMCRIDEEARNRFSGYNNYCAKSSEFVEFDGYDDSICIPSRSLPNYVAALNNRTTCNDITSADVSYVKTLLTDCKQHYDAKTLVGNCWIFDTDSYTTKRATETRYPACDLPVGMEKCARFEAVYDILHSLTPSSWDMTQPLSYAQSIMQAEDVEDEVTLWEQDFEPFIGYSDGGATVDNIYMDGIKGELFNKGMLGAAPNFLVLVIITYIVILIHTGSFWITTCGILQIFCAFLWGFVLYTVVFWRNFFPFLNLIALFLIMGVGADDIFVYVDAWRQSFAKLPENCPLDQRLSWTLRRAGSAMLVTTATTAISFLANMTNPITAMKGFGLFTASVILSDFLLMIIFIPATISVHHLHFSKMATKVQITNDMNGCSKANVNDSQKVCAQYHIPQLLNNDESELVVDNNDPEEVVDVIEKANKLSMDENRAMLSNKDCCCRSCCCCTSNMDIDIFAVPTEIDSSTGTYKERWAESMFRNQISPVLLHSIGRWVFITITMVVAGFLYTSAIQLEKPSSSYMQLLDESHPLEVYEKTQQNWFDIGNGQSFDFPYYFVFGLEPIDNGDFMDPSLRGKPIYENIDISLPLSQQYIYEFCEYVANWHLSPQSTLSLDTNPCGMYWFKEWMETTCASTSDDSDNWMYQFPERTSSGCCDKSSSDFPYPVSTFNTCMEIFSTKMAIEKDANHGFWFDTSGNLKVLVISGSSIEKYSQTFSKADSYYNALVNFFKARGGTIGSVPSGSGLENAFAYTEIGFYAMQSAITQGAYDSAMYSTIFALVVLVLLTKRFVSSILVAFHLACVVVCVLGVFVRLGWVLGVVESVIAALAVGLACDFAAHLAHSFNDEQPHPEEDTTPFTFPRTMKEFSQQLQLAKIKATGAITNLGVTITMGFLSTFFAGCCLLVTSMYFTQQFGIFMCCVMAFSFSFAFLYLMPTLATIGWTDRLLANWTDDMVIKPIRDYMGKCTQNGSKKVANDEIDESQVTGDDRRIELIATPKNEIVTIQGNTL